MSRQLCKRYITTTGPPNLVFCVITGGTCSVGTAGDGQTSVQSEERFPQHTMSLLQCAGQPSQRSGIYWCLLLLLLLFVLNVMVILHFMSAIFSFLFIVTFASNNFFFSYTAYIPTCPSFKTFYLSSLSIRTKCHFALNHSLLSMFSFSIQHVNLTISIPADEECVSPRPAFLGATTTDGGHDSVRSL